MAIRRQFLLGAALTVQFSAGVWGGQSAVREPVAAVSRGERWGFINRQGGLVFKQQFDGAGDFCESLAEVQIGGKWGYIDATGSVVIAPRFDGVSQFSGGLATVALGKKFGFIDRTGNWVVGAQFDLALPLSCGLGLVKLNGKFGYVDRDGKMAIAPQFDSASSFCEGLAYVESGGKKGFIDKKGKIVTNLQIDKSTAATFSEGMAPVQIDGKYGYIDTSGKLAIQPQFGWAFGFSEGLAAVANEQYSYFFIDKTGRAAVPAQYDGSMGCRSVQFSEGLAAAWFGRPGHQRCGFIDRTGRVVARTKLDPVMTLIGPFHEGLATFGSAGTKYGYLNKSGKIAISAQFDSAHDFSLPDAQYQPHGCGKP